MEKTPDQLRRDFVAYWIDLRREARANGFYVNRATEWEYFLDAHRDKRTGELPNVKMPRTNRV